MAGRFFISGDAPPTVTLESETHCCGPRWKISWRCWIWTCGLFSDNPTPTIVAIPSNAPSKLWEWLNRVFFVNTGISPWQTMIFSSTSLGWSACSNSLRFLDGRPAPVTGCDKWMLDDRPWATLRSCDLVQAWLVGGKWLSRACQMFFKPF